MLDPFRVPVPFLGDGESGTSGSAGGMESVYQQFELTSSAANVPRTFGTFAPPMIRRFALSPTRRYPTIAASFRTVFQFRPVPGVPNFFSISLAVNLDCPTPAG